MDQDVINLAKAIRQRESGGNFSAVGDAGTSKGGYQWQPATWKEHSKKILGNENAEMTPENQNAVAYGMIKTWKDQGLNPAQIAAKWNSGSENGWENKVGTTTINGQKVKYNVPAYVKEVTDTYQSFKEASMPKAPVKTASQMADEESASKYGSTFQAEVGGGAVGEAIKTVGNIPKSAFNFAKGLLDMLNPVSTINKIKEIASGTKALADETGGYKNAFGAISKELPQTAYESFVPEAGRALLRGDTETAQRSITNDPFGQIAPFIFMAKSSARVADTVANKRAMANYVKEPYTTRTIPKPTTKFDTAFETGMSKISGLVTKPTSFVASKVSGGIASATRAGIAQATGLNKETIPQIIKSPEAFTRKSMAETDRASLGRQVQSELAKLAEEKSATGKEYQPIRESKTIIKVESNFWDDTFKETTGLDIKKGNLTPTTTSKIRDAGDVRALQKVYEFWKPKFKQGALSADEYLNLREDLAKASKFEKDIGKRKDVEILTGQIRAKLNSAYRPQVQGLKDLDLSMSEQIAQYKELTRGLVDKDGTITDAGMARIANLSKNKPNLAAQLEKIVPGITEQVKNLQAIVDIERASGIKVGTYTKGAIVGGGLAFGGPIQAVINLILTSPQLAVPILRQYGLLKNSAAVKAVMTALKEGGNKLNNPGATLSPYMNKDVTNLKLKVGLGIEDVSKGNMGNAPKKVYEIYSSDNPKTGFTLFKKIRATEEMANKYVSGLKKGGYAYKQVVEDVSPKGKGVVAPEKTTTGVPEKTALPKAEIKVDDNGNYNRAEFAKYIDSIDGETIPVTHETSLNNAKSILKDGFIDDQTFASLGHTKTQHFGVGENSVRIQLEIPKNQKNRITLDTMDHNSANPFLGDKGHVAIESLKKDWIKDIVDSKGNSIMNKPTLGVTKEKLFTTPEKTTLPKNLEPFAQEVSKKGGFTESLPKGIISTEIKRAKVFGSSVKGGKYNDVDVVLFLDENHPSFKKIGSEYNKKVGNIEYHVLPENDIGQSIFDAMLDMKKETGKGFGVDVPKSMYKSNFGR